VEREQTGARAEGDALNDAVGRYGMFFGESVSFQKKDLTKQTEA